eukprot:TRINITY_DN61505_c0_g1_i1.p1 TRINITY_DN61505_c0_g1~~TRINITY_DN61505_c0_g1_i1.p1  ORF type:complete len:233 (+),score=44.69 TRINITY_DN61505_c0_g1_i1:151-849(+)
MTTAGIQSAVYPSNLAAPPFETLHGPLSSDGGPAKGAAPTAQDVLLVLTTRRGNLLDDIELISTLEAFKGGSSGVAYADRERDVVEARLLEVLEEVTELAEKLAILQPILHTMLTDTDAMINSQSAEALAANSTLASQIDLAKAKKAEIKKQMDLASRRSGMGRRLQLALEAALRHNREGRKSGLASAFGSLIENIRSGWCCRPAGYSGTEGVVEVQGSGPTAAAKPTGMLV